MHSTYRQWTLAFFWIAMAGGIAGMGCGGDSGCPPGQTMDFKFGLAAEPGCVFTCLNSGNCPSGEFCTDNPLDLSSTCEACTPTNFPSGSSFECDSDADCGGADCVGCRCTSSPDGCTTNLNVAGTWTSNFACEGPGTPCFQGSDTLEVTQNGTSVGYTDMAAHFSTTAGTLCDFTFTWSGTTDSSAMPPGFDESGVWTFSDENNFTKTSDFTRKDGSGGGHCEGAGAKSPNTPPPPPDCPL